MSGPVRWDADAREPLAIYALWPASPDDYLLDFGDGTPAVRVSRHSHRAVRHEYADAGRFVVVARPLNGSGPVGTATAVVRAVLGPRARWEPLGRGRVRLVIEPVEDPVRHRVDWGDGSPAEVFGRDQLNPEHTYTVDAAGLVATVTDEPAHRIARLPVPAFLDRPAPEFALRRQDTTSRNTVCLLFQPPTGNPSYDHRAVEHRVDWGDGTSEIIPAGQAHAAHTYPSPVPWPADVPLPRVTATDTEAGVSAVREAAALRGPYVYFRRPTEPGAQSEPNTWTCLVSGLPASPSPTGYSVWSAGRPIHQATVDAGVTAFSFTAKWPPGWCSVDVVDADSVVLCTAALRSGDTHQGHCAYDWDLDDPRLITCTPWLHSPVWAMDSFDVTWDDGSPVQRFDGRGACPQMPHWYERHGSHTVSVRPVESVSVSHSGLGPCVVGEPRRDPQNPRTVLLPVQALDDTHSVRVDWGDRTPVTRRHPRAEGGQLSHTYADDRAHAITVYAPMQDPVRVALPSLHLRRHEGPQPRPARAGIRVGVRVDVRTGGSPRSTAHTHDHIRQGSR